MLNVIHSGATMTDRRLRTIGENCMRRMKEYVVDTEYGYIPSYAAEHFQYDYHWRFVPHAMVVAFNASNQPVAWFATEFLIKPRNTYHAVLGHDGYPMSCTQDHVTALRYERDVVASDYPTVRSYTYDPYKGIYILND